MKEDIKEMAQRINLNYLIRNVPFLSCLNPEEIAEFKRMIVEKQFVKNQIVLLEEDTPNYLYFVFTGQVKIVQVSEDGKERILSIHKRGDFFGEMAILDGRTAPATVVAIEDSRIGLISRDIFNRHLLNNNRVLKEIIILLCTRLRDSWSMVKIMGFADAEHRVRAVLKYMGERFGLQEKRGTVIDLKLTHSDIANFAALSRETTTRIINRLKQAKEIETVQQKYLLRKSFFRNYPDLL